MNSTTDVKQLGEGKKLGRSIAEGQHEGPRAKGQEKQIPSL